ncbi:MAG: flagellar hook-length control protein FliK [Nitrosomonas sp.]|nr:flagellar hook-length control protein FliK [Nitrosomonas sp.]MCW5607116.1 flagellar hook-length control protein FliK [Nitrosomonas sp.]
MLNPIAPVQIPTQVQQPEKGYDGQNHSSKSESGKFDTILAREVAEKESAPVADHAKKTTPDTNSKSAESVSTISTEKGSTTDKTGIAKVTKVADATDAVDIVDNTTSTANANNEFMANQIQVAQILFPGNSVNVEIMPPIVSAEVPAENFVLHNVQPGLNEKSVGVIPPAPGLTIAAAIQSFQFSSQEGPMQNPAGNGGNNLRHTLQAAHFVDDSALPLLTSEFQKNLFTRVGEMNFSLQTDLDMPQLHSQSGLSGVTTMGEAALAVQIGLDAPQHAHSQSGLSGVTQTASNAAVQTVTPQPVGLDTQMGQPKWGNEFAQKIVWLAHQHHQVAELRLNPAHLGPVEIVLSLTGDNGTQASAQFVSPHPAVREAIETALPRLREMMAESGIQLGDVMVGAESFQRQEQGERQGRQHVQNANGFNARDESNLNLEKQFISNRHNGIVNTFA